MLLRARFSDAQCGFKAIRADVARALLPLVEDNNWFFDTELLVLAERAGCASTRCPSTGSTTPTRVSTSWRRRSRTSRGIARMGRGLASGVLKRRVRSAVTGVDLPPGMGQQLVRFAGIGLLSTLAYVALFFGLSGPLGTLSANAVALLLTAVLNTAANRRLTFGTKGAAGMLRQHAEGLVVFALGLGMTSLALFSLNALVDRTGTRCSSCRCCWPPTPGRPCCGSCSSAAGSSAPLSPSHLESGCSVRRSHDSLKIDAEPTERSSRRRRRSR